MVRTVAWNTGVFLSWTLTSFLCHQFAKKYLQQPDSNLYDVIIVTVSQLGLCFASLQENNVSSNAKKITKHIAAAGHVVATITTNYSLFLVHASSTLAIKVIEPVSSVIIQWVILSTPIPLSTTVSLPIIVAGAVMFTGSPVVNSDMTFGLGLALTSNLALAVRNIAIKLMFEDGQKLFIRSVKTILIYQALTIPLVISLWYFKVTDNALGILFVLVSATAHVAYSYLSVALMLKSVSVVTHAVLNIFKRIFVVLLLCMFGTRSITDVNLLGLILASVGLGVYVFGKIQSSPERPANIQDMVKINRRLFSFLLMCVGIVGLAMFMKSHHSPPSVTLETEVPAFITKRHVSFLDMGKERDIKWDAGVNPSFPDEGELNKTEYYTQFKGQIPGFPFDTNKPVITQTTIADMIRETQRLHFLVFDYLIGQQQYVVLIDLATHENKGDSAIGLGEVILLRKLKKKVIFYCGTNSCDGNSLITAKEKAMHYGPNNVAVLCHGGGNIVSYPAHDGIRLLVFSMFRDFKIVVFPQSIWLRDSQLLEERKHNYSMYPNVTLLMRDKQSLRRAQEHFSKNNLILCPDMAYQIGNVPRSMGPQYDVIWMKRTDPESSKYNVSNLDNHDLTIKIDDWIHWMPSTGFTNTMEKIEVSSQMGFTFLMRGRVAITDRLHGHILSTMLHMPHVLLDTSDHKLAAYHDTWTKGLEGNTVLVAKTPQEAVDKAWELVERFKNKLPMMAPYMHLEDGVA